MDGNLGSRMLWDPIKNRFWLCASMWVAALCLVECVRGAVVEPLLVGQWPGYEHGGGISRMEVSEGRLYLADSQAGMHILDVSNRAKPVRIGGYSYFPGGWNQDLKVVGNIALVTPLTSTLEEYGIGLEIVDVSDAAAPKGLGRYHVFKNRV